MAVFFRYKTECPRCGKISSVGSDEPNPAVKCGDCLMNDVEVVQLKLTDVERIMER